MILLSKCRSSPPFSAGRLAHKTCVGLCGAAIQYLNFGPATTTYGHSSAAMPVRHNDMLPKKKTPKPMEKVFSCFSASELLSVRMPRRAPYAGSGRGSCEALLAPRLATLQSASALSAFASPHARALSTRSSASAPLVVVAGDGFGAAPAPAQPQPGGRWGFHRHHWKHLPISRGRRRPLTGPERN